LAETVGLELARLHAQLEVVYKAGFVDTATGSSLENVVALLGITRVRGGRAAGQVEFRRAAGTPGSITIPRGTRVMTADGEVEYETTESVTMSAGQEVARAAARDLENNDPLPADALTVLPAPIAGIAAVANPAPTALGTPDETDDELRERAKNFLHGSERATLGALRHAVARQQITADVVEFEDRPGYIEITPHAETMPPELKERLLRAIEDARPAGVVVKLNEVEPVRKVNLALRLVTLDNLPEADLRAAQRTVRSGIEDYFRRLPAREPASINQLVGAVLAVPQVKDVRVVAATVNGGNVLDAPAGLLQVGGFPTALGELTLADPNLPTVVSLLATFPSDQAPPDRTAIEAALAAALGYLSTLNTVELPTGATDAEKAHRVLSFRKLLRVVPLPGKPGATLEALDQAPGTPLPAEADVAPYRVKAVVTQESGLSRVLEHDADAYTLSPFERLVPGGVEVKAEATNG
jgi:hypothetical protein